MPRPATAPTCAATARRGSPCRSRALPLARFCAQHGGDTEQGTRLLAYHEAAHVVVGAALGGHLDRVRLSADGYHGGASVLAGGAERIAVDLAGRIAAALVVGQDHPTQPALHFARRLLDHYLGRREWPFAGARFSDFDSAAFWALEVSGHDGPRARELLRSAADRALAVLLERWGDVGRLAEALLRGQEIRGDDELAHVLATP